MTLQKLGKTFKNYLYLKYLFSRYEEEIKNLKNKLNEEKENYNKGIENLKYDSEKKDAEM